MNRFLFAVVALVVVPAIALGQQTAQRRGGGRLAPMLADGLLKADIAVERDVPYAGTDNRRQRLDIYLPKKPRSKKLPVVVFIHGGGWQAGDKTIGATALVPLVRTGDYAGVSVGYRLTDETSWPAQIYDCKAAIRWVRANAEKYGFDPDRIGVWGKSAGGHLALMLGVSGDVPELEGKLGDHQDVSSKVACVVNFFGVADFLAEVGQPSNIDRRGPNSPEAKLIGGPLRDNQAKAKSASPVTYVTSNDPPVLTVHGTADRTVPYDQAKRIDATLKKAGVPSYFVTVEGAGHGNFGRAADDRVEAFFGKYLLGKDVEISTKTIEWKP